MVSTILTPPQPLLIQKYGGTSLGNHLGSVCDKIVPSYLQDFRVALVCSAVSAKSKTTGTTSLLLQCISFAESGTTFQGELHRTVDAIRNNHFSLVERYIQPPNDKNTDIGRITRKRVREECETLRRFLLAAQIMGELSSRAKDRVISLGEKLASIIVSACLVSKGISSHVIILDDLVECVFGPDMFQQKLQYDGLYSQFYHRLACEIGRRIHAGGDSVPVITGFFGIMPESLLKTVGRGYSDVCAAMCALGAGASELQIWKEVDGIFTADPRKVPSARLLSTVTAEEATELTYYGSEVIHPLTMDLIKCANIPLRLRNVLNPGGRGTIIYPSGSSSLAANSPATSQSPDAKLEHPISGFMLENGYHGEDQERRAPTAVTVKDSITLINVTCNRNIKSRGFLANVLTRLEEDDIAIDLVTTSERNISLAIQASENDDGVERKAEVGLEKFGRVVFTRNMSIVTVVGHKMRNMVGISSEILSVLAASKINIYLVSQGATEINVSLVVRAEDAVLAMNVIHGKVLGIPTHWEQETNFIKGPWLY